MPWTSNLFDVLRLCLAEPGLWLLLLGNWNTNGPGASLAEPLDTVDVNDLLALLAAWGDC